MYWVKWLSKKYSISLAQALRIEERASFLYDIDFSEWDKSTIESILSCVANEMEY